MKYALIYLGGGITASAWWAYARWPDYNDKGLIGVAIILTMISVVAGVAYVINTKQ